MLGEGCSPGHSFAEVLRLSPRFEAQSIGVEMLVLAYL
jgi:hypothetical protein